MITQEKEIKGIQWKVGSKTFIVYRWHHGIPGKSHRLLQITVQVNKAIWQNYGIQSQYSEIRGILGHQQWNIRNWNQRKKSPWYSNMYIKWLGIKLVKEVKDLYSEHYTTWKKERTNILKHTPCSWSRSINILKISIPFKAMYRSMQFLLKNQWYFTAIKQTFQNLHGTITDTEYLKQLWERRTK